MNERTKTSLLGVVVLLGLIFLAGCNFPGNAATPDFFATAAAETVSAQLTRVGSGGTPGLPIEAPSETPVPLETNAPATTSAPPATTDANCTNRAAFVSDVTIPDDTILAAGESFTKTWRLRNDGSCTWSTEYEVIFATGNIMGGPSSQALPAPVPPSGTVDISLALTAPSNNGTHKSEWRLRDAADQPFGLGSDGQETFYVQIIVGATPTPRPEEVYNFVDKMCDADWTGSPPDTTLLCPGAELDSVGFVIKLDNPKFENGTTDDEPALWTHPRWVDNGSISGLFPNFTVREGDRFRAVLACRFNGLACDVKLQLRYRDSGGSMHTLQEWSQTYDGSIQSVSVDLSSLKDQTVRFALVVLANGASDQDWALWLLPRIEGQPRN
jgi:hypothetical protein